MNQPATTGPDPASQTTIEFRGGKALSALPIVFFIAWAIFQSGILAIGDTAGLIAGMLIGLVIGMLFVKGPWKSYADAIFEGMSQPVAVTAIVAWLWAGMFSATLQVGGFVDGLGWLAQVTGVGPTLFPAITFILAGLLATGIGTGYGTTIAFVALFFPAGVALGADPVLMLGAILSGAVFGDNLAPVSDTTIVSAVTQDSDVGGVVASRFKYAITAAILSLIAYVIAASMAPESNVSASARELFEETSNPAGLLHLLSMGTVIFTAIAGRHIIEAISWGLIVAIVINVVFGLAPGSDMLVFNVPEGSWAAETFAGWPLIATAESASVGGSIYDGAFGFVTLSVLILLVIAGAQIMIRGGGFQALQDFLLRSVAKTVRSAEVTMVTVTAGINAAVTINTAAEIAIAPYIAKIGKKFNINGYRRANILDANTSALGYIFPWSGGVLVAFTQMNELVGIYPWFTQEMVVSPVAAWPWVFHGWLLVFIFLFAAITGFGREYTSDRISKGASTI
ncbi:Na+/H+ antiporter NhaC family protein [Wenzhouxiangella sediminis]|uniref:Na+/H+ antiporter NhaC family protein n=1 Tax=Wenzhouxiangella sediminis TaxID=1792836 RepID=A0A3E1KAJ2_9GAMM|nr:Na+/H+ antiporter NhaC family protein [Wenzhouxiangella sediminis]RFF31384.1 Na+/H+ antiporter NhaC family protein [Wenzhouxiangella sediminis]